MHDDVGVPLPSPTGDETIAALRGELRMRAAAEAHLRGKLADAAAELEARVGVQARLESAHAELRHELDQLRGLVEQEAVSSQALLSRVRGELAASEVSREAAASEAAGLRSELERLGAELAAARERVGSEAGGLGEAEALLAEARALRARILEQHERGAGG